MLQTQCLFCSPPTIKLCSRKYSHEKKVPHFGNNMHEKSKKRSQKNGKLGVKYYNAHTYLTSIHYPLESKLRLVVKSGGEDSGLAVKSSGQDSGIGIARFYQGKNIFITGGTGLLGKVLVEKLLRSTSVGKIYLLVRANDKEAAFGRLSKEMIESELFESLREKHGKSYEEFVGEKLIPIAGNICEPNLGMDESSMHALMEDVHVIIESGANTTFNGRYDILMDTNLNAPQRLMRLAKRCKNLKLFVHISTAYVNGKGEGVIYEKPLVMGENGRNEDGALSLSSFHDGVDIANEINLATKSCIASVGSDTTQVLESLGVERAAFLGWNNAYTLTKAMGEMILNEIRGDVPLLIMRPTIIESSYKEPIPGWIQGIRMSEPVIIAYAKGMLPAFMADPRSHLDIVPVDMVANTIVAAIAKHGVINKPELNVYHVATDFVNPFRASDLCNYTYEHFSANPLKPHAEPIKKMKLFHDFSDFSRYISDELSGMRNSSVGIGGKKLQKLQKRYKAKVAYAEQLCKIYEFATFFKARFHTGNTRKLLEEMSKEERVDFEVDATKIDWRKYFVEIHIPGIRKHLLN